MFQYTVQFSAKSTERSEQFPNAGSRLQQPNFALKYQGMSNHVSVCMLTYVCVYKSVCVTAFVTGFPGDSGLE